MALLCNMLCIWTLFLPCYAEGGRPFHIPSTLFSPALKNAHLSEFAREIRAAGNDFFEQNERTDYEEEAFIHGARRRRNAPASPVTSFKILNDSHDTLYMYWTPSSQKPNNILLLAKNTNVRRGPSSNVYNSTDFGRTWNNINDMLKVNATTFALIDQIYISKVNPLLCVLTDVTNKALFITKNMKTFAVQHVSWVPSHILPHPRDSRYILGHDKVGRAVYFSDNEGTTWTRVDKNNVRFFEWGIEGIDKDPTTFYVESLVRDGATTSEVTKFSKTLTKRVHLLGNVLEFDIKKNFMFATVKVNPNQIKLKVSHNGMPFVDAQFPSYEKSVRDYFVFDVEEDQVFVVINHLKNASHMYISDFGGVKYYLSIERVLYHNPWTDVSSPWLRSVVPYAFVDVHKINSMRGTYVATQLTPGRVGRRHLLNLITYNKGGKWQRVRSPTRDINGNRIYCFYPSCSLHFNLKYGSVYHVSPSEAMMSKESIPGLVMALGVASTNLKIYPDFYLSTDGGFNWKRVKRGKYQFAVGNFGSAIVAVPYRRPTQTLHYSLNGGDSWKTVRIHNRLIYSRDLVSQPGEKLLKFLIYGHEQRSSKWVIVYVDMTSVLTRECNPETDYMQWTPSDGRIGDNSCIMGRQITYLMRNWTASCKVPGHFTTNITMSSCPCTRTDFMCDFGFARRSFDQDCSLIPGEDLNKDGIVPASCREGLFYNRTRGYRKIPGDSCKGGYESDFFPVLTPCPVENLNGLTVTNSRSPNKILYLAVGDNVTFTATVVKGYIANIMFRWDFGYNNKVQNGTGSKYATISHVYTRAGHFVLMVTAHNTKSTLIKRIDVYVQAQLDSNKINVMYSPSHPSINKPVLFTVSVTGYSASDKGSLTYKWDFGQGSFQAGKVSMAKTFTQARSYTVRVQISNKISKATKQVRITVAEELEGLVVKANSSSRPTVYVAVGSTVSFTATLTKGNVANVIFTWDFGEDPKLKQTGVGLASTHYTYLRPGLLVVKVTAKNSKTTLTYQLSMSVQQRLDSSKLRIFFNPPDPSSNQPVSFTATVVGYTSNAIGSLTYKWNFGDGSAQDTSVSPTHSFSQSRSYTVTVQVANKVSKATKSTNITVTEDLTPKSVSVSLITKRTATISWGHPVAHDRFIDGYKIYKSTQKDSGFTLVAAESDSTVLSRTVTRLTPYTKYYFKVAAYSEGQLGPFSEIATATTLEDIPSEPTNFRAFPKTSTSIQLQWGKPAYPNGKITKYGVLYWSSKKDHTIKSYGPSQAQVTLNGLKENTLYNFQVFAETAKGKGPPTDPLSIKTNISAPTMPPRKVRATFVNVTCIWLRWEPPYMASNDQRLFPAKNYIVYADNKKMLTTNFAYALVCSLTPDTPYAFEVQAQSVKGPGPRSNKTVVRTLKLNPTAPAEFTVNIRTPRAIEFTWEKPKVVDGSVKSYVIDQVEPAPNKGPFSVPGDKYEFKLSGLTPYTVYKFRIGAKSSSGRTSWSDVKEVRTPEDVPDTLTSISIETRVEQPTSSTIRLVWRVPRPNGVITGFKIRWGHVSEQRHLGSKEIDVTDPSVREYVFKHLHSNTEYSFAVRPRTKIGESPSFSEPIMQFTGPAKNLTERLSVKMEGLAIGTVSRRSEDEKPTLEQFVSQFIKEAAKAAKLTTDERIAAVDVKGNKVEFDLLPPLKEGDVSTKDAKASLSKGFQVGKAKAVKGSLVVVHVYVEHKGIQGTVKPPKVGAQTGVASISKNTLALAVVIPIVIIGLALLVGLVFYYRKYKNLENRYGRVTGDFSGNQMSQMNMVYNSGMTNDVNDEIYIDDAKKKKRVKDDEKLPLGEHDELATI